MVIAPKGSVSSAQASCCLLISSFYSIVSYQYSIWEITGPNILIFPFLLTVNRLSCGWKSTGSLFWLLITVHYHYQKHKLFFEVKYSDQLRKCKLIWKGPIYSFLHLFVKVYAVSDVCMGTLLGTLWATERLFECTFGNKKNAGVIHSPKFYHFCSTFYFKIIFLSKRKY